MSKTVADDLWEILYQAGVRRCYGIVGDALNPTVAALQRRKGDIELIHVRHEEYGTFAANAESFFTGAPVAVCGTAGPGVTHLLNGLIDAFHERVKIIAVAGDVETSVMELAAIEEVNPYALFDTCSLFTGRVVNAESATAVISRAVRTCLIENGPVVIAMPGDIANSKAEDPRKLHFAVPDAPIVSAPQRDVDDVAALVNAAEKITIFGGDGCRDARDEVIALGQKLNAPVGFTYKGKQWLESGNPNAVGLTGLLGYGGCYEALTDADVVLMLGADFPFPGFLGHGDAKYVQVDTRPGHLGRRVPLAKGLVSDTGEFVRALLPKVTQKTSTKHLDKALKLSARWDKKKLEYARESLKPIRVEYLLTVLNELMDDDAIVTIDTGTPTLFGAHYIEFRDQRRMFASASWASMANAAPNAFGAALAYPGRQIVALCGDGGFSMLGLGDLITQVNHKTRVVHVILDNGALDFVEIEQQEAGFTPYGVELPNPNFAKVAEAFGARGIRIEDPADVRSALNEALAHTGGPVVVDAVVERAALALPSHVPADTLKGFTLSVTKQVLGGDLGHVVELARKNIKLL